MSAKLMGQVWDLDLPPNESKVLMSLADHADHDGGNVCPGVELTAWKTGYSERQVRRIQKLLERRGILILVEDRRKLNRPSIYRIEIDHVARKKPREVTTGQDVRRTTGQNVRRGTGKNVRRVPPDKMTAPSGHNGVRTPPDIQMSDESLTTTHRTTPPDADASPPRGLSGDGGVSISLHETGQPASSSDSIIVDLRPRELPAHWPRLLEEAAKSWMEEILDQHPYLLQFNGSRKAAIRATVMQHIRGEHAHVWTDAAGVRVPWNIRPAALNIALGLCVEQGGSVADKVRRFAIPQILDPFPVKTSNAPKPGTEAARVRSETPGVTRQGGSTDGLQPIAQKRGPEKPVRDDIEGEAIDQWCATHQQAVQRIQAALSRRIDNGEGPKGTAAQQAWLRAEFRAAVLHEMKHPVREPSGLALLHQRDAEERAAASR